MTTDNDTKSLYDRCKSLLQAESILDVLEAELRSQGFAGPCDVPKLVFLCLYTEFFEKPVSLLIKGPSGSGKSYALQAGLQFVPEEAYQMFSGMSDKALLYLDLNLKHRYLIIGEAAGYAKGDGRAFLRQLLSEGSVNYATVQSTKNGLKGEIRKPLEGPVGLIMTTTANALHSEDESRMLSYHLDESVERVKATLVSQALGSRGSKKEIDTDRWFALHQYVGSGSLTVDIPFAEEIARRLPPTHFRVQRDFPQILSLIRAYALLHQFSRGRSVDGVVTATIDDYRGVYDLVERPLAHGLDVAVTPTVRELVQAVKDLTNHDGKSKSLWDVKAVSQVQLAEKLRRHQSVVSRNLASAIEQGFLRDRNPGQGRTAEIMIGDREVPSGSVLPHPDDLETEELPLAA